VENGYDHGGQSKRERTTWIATNAKGLNSYFFHGQPGIVDILPSMASFLKVKIPRNQLFELDGVPVIGKISATNLQATLSKDVISLKWKVADKQGKAKIWMATTNNFKTGGKDNYMLMKEVPVVNGAASINVKNHPSAFYKIVLEMPYNVLNRWIVIEKK
jgi:hypothetical protein